jgi:hypothetical protein
MDLRFIRKLVEWLDARNVVFEQGLSDSEVTQIEDSYGFHFPPDLRKWLQHAMPVGERFPDWRGSSQALRDALEWPAAGILHEVEEHHFWVPSWGEQPSDIDRALATARALLATAPPLVPVYGHRYIPTEPSLPGNPVFSIVGTDVLYAGCDLASFFATEFGVPCPAWAAVVPREIAFWDTLVA